MKVFYKFLLAGGLWSKEGDLSGGKAHLGKSKGHLLCNQLQLAETRRRLEEGES